MTQLFAKYGDVVMVRICSRGGTGKLPSWLNKAVEDINMGVGHGEFALIEFGTEDDCVACVTKTKNLDNWYGGGGARADAWGAAAAWRAGRHGRQRLNSV